MLVAVGEAHLAAALGAGFGMHAVPLARRGASVTAIDSSAKLLRTLADLAPDLSIRTVNDNLLRFHEHIDEAPSAILCMGDTIAHLPSFGDVEKLLERVATGLTPGGVLVLSLRDYSVSREGDERFIPVKSDAARILTCFLEYEPEAVLVHDIVHERTTNGWQTRVSHYRKLRLEPERVVARLASLGLDVRREPGINGMVRLVARKG